MQLEPRHLAQLASIVELGSFQVAADRLGISQPALSRNMRTLELRVGSPLFDRSSRRSVPTSLGVMLAQNGLAVRTAVEQAENFSNLVATGAAGELRIGAPPIIAGRFLTDHISRFMRDRPACRIDLRVGLVDELRVMLERAQIDMVIGPRALADGVATSRFTPMVDDRVGILCRVGHPLAARGVVGPMDLETQRWVAHSRGSMLRHQTESALSAFGLGRIEIAMETDSIQSVLEVVSTTDLISTMPRVTIRPYITDELRFLDVDHAQFHRPIGIIEAESAPPNKILHEFTKALLSSLEDGSGHE